MLDTDVFVIGGGPAGLAAAMAARRKGLRAMVADGNRPPVDKACGEGLMPDSIAAARRIGIELRPEDGFPFRGVRFYGECREVEADFPRGRGIGFRRTVLHRRLVEQAAEAGVEMLWSTPVAGIDGTIVHTKGGAISARWIVGADGSGSLVRRWAGLDRFARKSLRFAYRRHFAIEPWSEFMEIHWGDRCQAYVTPVSPREMCVAFISSSPELRLAKGLQRFPQLERRLRGAEPTSPERGAVTATARLRNTARGNVALVGDASGGVDAITGEGLCQAFQQAEALAKAFARGELSEYTRQHRRIAKRPAFMADLMLTLVRWPTTRRRAFSALAADPNCLADLLAGHVGALKPYQMAGAGLSLGWRMLIQ